MAHASSLSHTYPPYPPPPLILNPASGDHETVRHDTIHMALLPRHRLGAFTTILQSLNLNGGKKKKKNTDQDTLASHASLGHQTVDV